MRNHHFTSLSLVLGTSMLAFSGNAAADSCPAPTLEQCQDKSYLDTACGQAQKGAGGACTTLLTNAYQQSLQSTPNSEVKQTVSAPNSNDAPAPITVVSKQYAFDKHVLGGSDAQFSGTVQRSQLATATGMHVADPATQFSLNATASSKQAWAANGDTVGSCEEYVYERYYDWHAYKNAVDAALDNDGAAADTAMLQAAPGLDRTLKSKSQLRTLPTLVFPSNGRIGMVVGPGGSSPIVDTQSPRNGYFAAYKSLLDGGFFASRPALRATIEAGLSAYQVSWNWHRSMRQQLAPLPDDELRYWDQKQRDFAQTVAERAATFAQPASADRTAALVALDGQIDAAFNDASAGGCLATQGAPSACDWSPRLLRDQVESFVSREEEKAYHKCISFTANDFGQARTARTTFNAPKEDYTTSADSLDDYFVAVNNWVNAQKLTKDPTTGAAVLGGRKADSGELGSSDIKLKWSYDAGWGVTGFDPSQETCNANLEVDGAFKADANAFGVPFSIIDARAAAATEQSKGTFKVYLKVAEQEIWNRWDNPYSHDLRLSYTDSASSRADKGFDYTFTVFGIPFTVEAGIGMEVGASVDMNVGVDGRCEKKALHRDAILASAKGSVRPWVQADAFAGAYIGIDGFKAGVRCDLVLVRGELPMAADAAIKLASNGAVSAKVTVSVKEVFRMLDGKIVAVVDGPWGLDAEETMFSWTGPKIDEDLVKFDKSIPLDALRLGGST